ncbi:MAG: glycerol-3-phosphate dehydrogenase/oxidase [Polyangiaceae bacterium]|nr:glycerol-3-phosphate dehydrogenase/oxidase [Polyangiaceae bacterium]
MTLAANAREVVPTGCPVERADVVVIGGGINGLGVARDAALRGLRVVLFERHDFGFGASGNSTGFVHGGPRYLLADPRVTRESCLDSGHIQRIAPHLVFRVPAVVPIERSRGHWSLLLHDAFFAAYDWFQPLKRGKPHVRLDASELGRLVPGLAGDYVGAVSFDEWGVDGVRLCIENAVDARRHGATLHNHTTVTEILRGADGAVAGVCHANSLERTMGVVSAPVVVNATGAWAPLTIGSAGLAPATAAVRPGKGIHLYFDRRLLDIAIVTPAIDGRQVFVLPWQNLTVVGTTDDDFYGDLDAVVATTDEVRYLWQAAARILPAIGRARAIGTWAGVRPTLHAWGPSEDALSRAHRIVDHSSDGLSGAYSMLGGKLASYRLFAEQMTDRVAARLGRTEPCRTATERLPGALASAGVPTPAQARVDPLTAHHLGRRYGSTAGAILARIAARPREGRRVCACAPVTEAEIRYVVEHEWARTVADVARRTRLGHGCCGGMRCAVDCGAIVADQAGQPALRGLEMAREFREVGVRARLPALGSTQARQEALALALERAELAEGGS